MSTPRTASARRAGAATIAGLIALGGIAAAPSAFAAENLEAGDLQITHLLNEGHRFGDYPADWNDGYGPIPIMKDVAVDGSPVDLGDPQKLWDGAAWRTPVAAEGESNPWGYYVRPGDHLLPQVRGAVSPIPAPQCAADTVRIKATAEVENLGPTAGQWTLGQATLLEGEEVLDSQPFGETGTTTPVGTVVPIELTADVPLASLQDGDIDFDISIETFHAGPKAWEFRDFTATYDVLCAPEVTSVSRIVPPEEPTTIDLTSHVKTDGAEPDWSTLHLFDPEIGLPVHELETEAGTYKIDGTTVVFTPRDGFSGEAPPITWYIADTEGTFSENATIDLTVARAPIAAPLQATTEATDPVLLDPVADAEARDGATIDPASVRLIDAFGELVTELTVPGEGRYTVDPSTGDIEFVAVEGFDGTVTAEYSIADSRGLRATSTIEVVVTRIPAELVLSDESIRADAFTEKGVEATISQCRAGEAVRFEARPTGGQTLDPIVIETVADRDGTASAVFAGKGDVAGDYAVTVTCGDVELTDSFTVTALPPVEPVVPSVPDDGALASTGGSTSPVLLWAALGSMVVGGALFGARVIRGRIR